MTRLWRWLWDWLEANLPDWTADYGTTDDPEGEA